MSEDARELDELIDDKHRYKPGKCTITINQKDLIDALRNELSEAQAEIERLSTELDDLDAEKSCLESDYDIVAEDLLQLKKDLNQIKADAVLEAIDNINPNNESEDRVLAALEQYATQLQESE